MATYTVSEKIHTIMAGGKKSSRIVIGAAPRRSEVTRYHVLLDGREMGLDDPGHETRKEAEAVAAELQAENDDPCEIG